MQNFRTEFPILQNCIYADTAASGPMGQGLVQWRQRHDMDYLNGGSTLKIRAMLEGIPEVRRTVGNFFHCPSENVALVQNFSVGLNLLLEGLDKKSRVLLLENDYPSVNWPFEDRGFPISLAKIDAYLEDAIWQKLRSENIDVLALSLVQWVDGSLIDMDFLKKVKKEFPHLIIIADGTQYCGMRYFNFEDSGIDILGSSGYKWLLAGFGNGFMLFREEIKKRFAIKAIGNNSVNGNATLRNTLQFVKRLEPGHLDTLNFGSLKYALDFLTTVGMEKITDHNKKLSDKAKDGFSKLGLLHGAVVQRKDHSAIFNIKGDDRLFRYLAKENVVCSQRGGGIRFSFHFYNTENDIDKIIDLLNS